ncbi:uncharacterized protein TNCV_2313901 [Trichonephila clavipes]|nr:uncharacterized protein TNCV_2313901 [Trichonephila clavipes]
MPVWISATRRPLPKPYRTEVTRATIGILATDLVILNHGHVTRKTPELALSLLSTTPHQKEDVGTLDRFNVHRSPTCGTRLELMTRRLRVRYLDP